MRERLSSMLTIIGSLDKDNWFLALKDSGIAKINKNTASLNINFNDSIITAKSPTKYC